MLNMEALEKQLSQLPLYVYDHIDLNTLEFSNHTGISWSGQSFKAFKKTTNKSEE